MLLDSQVALGYLRQEGFFRSAFRHEKQNHNKAANGCEKCLKMKLRKQKIYRMKQKQNGGANPSICFFVCLPCFPSPRPPALSFALTDFETLVA